MVAVRGEIVDGMIRGDLVGSRVSSHSTSGPVCPDGRLSIGGPVGGSVEVG